MATAYSTRCRVPPTLKRQEPTGSSLVGAVAVAMVVRALPVVRRPVWPVPRSPW